MKSLDHIRKRIKAIQATSKITNAMKLVATAKIKKQRKEFQTISEFSTDLYRIISNLVQINNQKDIFNIKNQKDSSLWIVITSSMGMCGAYNINACKHIVNRVKPNDKIIVVGKKGYSYFKSKGFEKNIIAFIEVDANQTNYLELIPISEMIVDMYITGEVKEINLTYTKFINSLTFNPNTIQILPLSKELFSIEDKKIYTCLSDKKQVITFESQADDILKSIVPIFVTSILYAAVSESRVCESAARRNAMETASDNAHKLIEDLTLQYNRARQENITQEINEIVAGTNQ